MKKKLYFVAFILLSFFLVSYTTGDCDSKTLKKEGITNLNPFFYSASKVNIISYEYKETRKEIEVPLFKGETYRLIFNKKGLPKDVVIEIYDKDMNSGDRTPLFSSKDLTSEIVSYEPQKSKKLYVNYVIPKADGEKKTGCMVFILGYQLTFLDDYNKNH